MKEKCSRKIQIKTFKKEKELPNLFKNIDYNSLALFAEMMRDRYGSESK